MDTYMAIKLLKGVDAIKPGFKEGALESVGALRPTATD